jgi:hypothetical protein
MHRTHNIYIYIYIYMALSFSRNSRSARSHSTCKAPLDARQQRLLVRPSDFWNGCDVTATAKRAIRKYDSAEHYPLGSLDHRVVVLDLDLVTELPASSPRRSSLDFLFCASLVLSCMGSGSLSPAQTAGREAARCSQLFKKGKWSRSRRAHGAAITQPTKLISAGKRPAQQQSRACLCREPPGCCR